MRRYHFNLGADEDKLISLPFDQYQRCLLLRVIARLFEPRGASLRVLDVGATAPAEALPGAFAISTAGQSVLERAGGVRAQSWSLPFPDASFDLVCSFDTLDRVPARDRMASLSEMLRVTSDGVFLAFPYSSASNRMAEEVLSEFSASQFRTSIPAIEEHRRFGLPDRCEVESFLSATGHSIASFHYGNTDAWLLMTLAQQSLRRSGKNALLDALNRRFNSGPAANDWAEPAYRVCFLLSKQRLAADLEAAVQSLRAEAGAVADSGSILPLCQLLLGMTSPSGAPAVELGKSREQTDQALESLTVRLDHLARQVSSVLQSRIWRTLCAVGARAAQLRRFLAGRDVVELVCDDPVANDPTPRAGVITVRGWALAQAGIASVDVRVDDGAWAPAHYGSARPDVARIYPRLKAAGRSGFTCDVDCGPLDNGLHYFYVRAISCSGAVCERELPLHVLHRRTFPSSYQRWIAEFETQDGASGQGAAIRLTRQPLVSVLMPVCDPAPYALERAVASVYAQSYSRWELCVADDASSSTEVAAILRERGQDRTRIKTTSLAQRGGISAATNAALAMARGEYIALLDHDDELAPDALLRMMEAVNREPDAGLLYSDEDKIDPQGRRFDPFFKPDWSPDLLLSENYICHLLVARTELVRAVGGFRTEYDGSQDYDLILRLTRAARKVVHVPAALYHWRAAAGSAALDAGAKSYAEDAARRALEDHLRCAGIAARVESGAAPGRWRIRYPIAEDSRVSILLASGGNLEILRANLDALVEKTTYRDYEIVVMDNSRGTGIERFVRSWQRNGVQPRYLDVRGLPFNYSALHNQAVRGCESPLLLFLNDDTEVIAPDWLTAMVELAVRPEVGAVGAKLLYPDARIQHAGVTLGVGGACGHAFKGLDARGSWHFDFPDVIRNVSAVTGACLMTRASVFREAGGFDEKQFAVAFNDVDLCLRIGKLGYRVLYTPHALLYHHEAFSKHENDLTPHFAEVAALQTNWGSLLANDPFYSPNLTRDAEDYSCRRRR